MDETDLSTTKDDYSAKYEAEKPSGNQEYSLDKNKYHKIICGYVKDEIDGQFKIEIGRPLPQFDSLMAKAFAVTNKFTKDTEKLVAYVLDKKHPVRLAEINKLKEESCDGMVSIHAAQVIPLSIGKGRFFTVIVQKPSGVKLSDYIKANGAISEEAAIKKIVPSIASVISFLAKRGIVHGRINLDNTYIDNDGKITVGECISETCGYSQPVIYDDVNRAASSPIGKGNGFIAATDYYALGVLVAIMLRGKSPTENLQDKEIVEKKLVDGTYSILTDGIELSPHLLDFLRGVINDNVMEVWNPGIVDEWTKGRMYNLLAQGKHTDAGRPISFMEKKYWKKKSLAHDLFIHWDEGKKFIRDDTLVRWIERNVGDSELSEKMDLLSKRTGGGESGSTFDKDDELLSQYILLLDPDGPIRLRNFSAMVAGIGSSLADAYSGNKQQHLDAISNIINYNLISYLDNQKSNIFEGSANYEAMFVLQRCRDLYKKKGIGFGLERCLYELNPTLSCQSHIVFDYVAFALSDLLKILNDHDDLNGKSIDRQLGAFLSMHMNLSVPVRVTSLSRFPDFAANANIQNLALLSMAQQSCDVGALPDLSDKIILNLRNVIDEFHSKYIRIDLTESLGKVAKKGSLPAILKIISDPQFLVRDRLGYRRAVTKYKNNAFQIAKLSNAGAVNNMGYRYGLQLSVLLSFFVTTAVVLVLIIRAF
ncbi:MAG: hypothetical protein K0R98_1496 [Rickettsiaceae bacterium]|jgi:serine/threonine protein kinase|nr:hypothetical protein [Rickettsiaceae bacterium]